MELVNHIIIAQELSYINKKNHKWSKIRQSKGNSKNDQWIEKISLNKHLVLNTKHLTINERNYISRRIWN